MRGDCPCGRTCADCVYEKLCGGCLEDGCVHVREREGRTDHASAKCLFCEMKGIHRTCPTLNPPPPKKLNCLGPWVLDDIIKEWQYMSEGFPQNPDAPDWPLLIPEVSDITETTSRLGVWPDEGDWKFRQWDPVAWDMTGYLFDKVQGAPWVHESEELKEEDWQDIFGPEESWVRNFLMVDRLPDRFAVNTPPTAIMVAFLNRLWAYQWRMFEEDAPQLWLLTHGYPSYVDWPPAWHWNLGIRMLSSLADYIGSNCGDLLGSGEGTWYPDLSKKTDEQLRLPFVPTDQGYRFLWNPEADDEGAYEMEWPRRLGIIPFVPGADTNQLKWFTQQIITMGYTTVALDAVNSIAHEDFKSIPEAVAAVLSGGAKHVIVYGPWPLHPPRKYIPLGHVSYIPTALHMDMTNEPRRFWRKRVESKEGEKPAYRQPPNYRRASLSEAAHDSQLEICECPACQAARTKELDPRSVWRWGHLLHAAEKWVKRAATPAKNKDAKEAPAENVRLWYQGPSYSVFRKCLHYPPRIQWPEIEHIIPALKLSETKMWVEFRDGTKVPATEIRWTWWDEGHHWVWEFPQLEE